MTPAHPNLPDTSRTAATRSNFHLSCLSSCSFKTCGLTVARICDNNFALRSTAGSKRQGKARQGKYFVLRNPSGRGEKTRIRADSKRTWNRTGDNLPERIVAMSTLPYPVQLDGSNSNGSTDSPSTQPGQPQHKRVYQACIPCRRRKVKCDLGSVGLYPLGINNLDTLRN